MIKKIIAASLFFLILQANAETVSNPDADMVKQTITDYMNKNHIPGVAVEIYTNGKPDSYYFGYANQDKKTPITKNTIFELGSITKIMTSLLLAQEVDTATVQFSDSITNFMPELPNAYEDITLLNLATHTSGLPFDVPDNLNSLAQLHSYLPTFTPGHSADETWTYSNFGMGMLGYALESVTHKNFNQMYIGKIMKPLNMQPIALTVPERYKRFYAQGYDKNGNPIQPASLGIFPTAYGIKASAGDMQKFLGAAIGLQGTPERILYPMRMTQAVYVRVPDKLQGLGWQIHAITPADIQELLHIERKKNSRNLPVEEIYEKPTFNGDSLIDKTGSTNGFRCYIALIPNKKTGIVILTNRAMNDNSIVETGREILFKLAKIDTEKTVETVDVSHE